MKAVRYIVLAVCAAVALCNITQAQGVHSGALKASKSTAWQRGLSMPRTVAQQGTPPAYLIVSVDSFQSTLTPFVRWKEMQGFDVETFYAPHWQRDSLRAILKERYYSTAAPVPAPSYLLLVGDAPQIAAWQGVQATEFLGDHNSDLYYGEYDNDGIPEVMQGRWPAQNKTQLGSMIRKTMAYEQYRLQDTSYLNNALLVAGYEERENTDIITNGQVHYLSQQLTLSNPAIDTHCFYNPGSNNQRDSILALWRQGAALVNYTAHCLPGGWHYPWINIGDIDSLPSEGHFSFVVNNCCHSNNFSTDCLGEALLRKDNGGAIGVIGAMAETLWDEDCFWAIGAKQPFELFPTYDSERLGAYDRLLHCHGEQYVQQAATLGEMLWSGNQAVAGYGSLFSEYYWEVYCLLGDPSLMPHIGIPQAQTLHCDDSLARGVAMLHFTGTPHAFVAVSEPPTEDGLQHHALLGVCLLDSTGRGTMLLRRTLATDSIIFCATAQNHRPIIEKHPVQRSATPSVVATEITLTNADGQPTHNIVCRDTMSLTITWKNVGSGTAQNLLLTIADAVPDGGAASPDSAASLQTTFLPAIFLLDSLAQDSTYTTVTRIVVGTAQTGNAAHYVAYAAQQGSTMPQRTLRYSLKRPTIVLEEVRLLLQDANDPRQCSLASKVLPGRKYWLQLIAHNTSDIDAATSRVCITSHEGADFTTAVCHTGVARKAGVRDTLFFSLQSDDTLSRLFFYIETYCNDYFTPYPVTFLADSAMETFERGTFLHYPWLLSSPHPWQIDSLQVHNGRYAARSAAITHRQRSDLSITVRNNAIDSIAFWTKISSESNGDKLVFYIDGSARKSWSGEQEWKRYRYMLAPGRHTLTWRYQKDATASSGDDAAWIDDIRLPLSPFTEDSVGYGDTLTRNLDIYEPDKDIVRVRCYPNPANDIVWVENHSDLNLKVALWDNVGRCLLIRQLPPMQTLQIPLRDLAPGSYILCAQSHNTCHNQVIIVYK